MSATNVMSTGIEQPHFVLGAFPEKDLIIELLELVKLTEHYCRSWGFTRFPVEVLINLSERARHITLKWFNDQIFNQTSVLQRYQYLVTQADTVRTVVAIF